MDQLTFDDLDETVLETEYTSAFPTDPAADAEELDRVLDLAGTIAPPEPELPVNPPEYDDLSPEEQATAETELATVTRSLEGSAKWAAEYAAKAAAAVLSARADKMGKIVKGIIARRILSAADIPFEKTYDGFVVTLGHLPPAKVETKLAELSKTIGALNEEAKSVGAGKHGKRVCLEVTIPSHRLPILVRFTTSPSDRFPCRPVARETEYYVTCSRSAD